MTNAITALFLAASVTVTFAAQAQVPTGGAMQHQHQGSVAGSEVKRSVVNLKVPAVTQMRQDGKKASFPGELDDGRAVILQFMYTSCTTVCPITTRTFSQVQELLSKESAKFHMVSVSIDPEHDTVKRLDEFSRKLGAGTQWHFFTGTLEASVALQKAFDVYRGDKMNHVPVTFLRAAPGKPWIRLDGLREPADVVKEYLTVAGSAIQEQETSSGSVVLSNLDGDDTWDPAAPAQSGPVNPVQTYGNSSGVSAPSSVRLEPESVAPIPADAASETAGDGANRSAKYRDNMLNPPLLPNGRPANPAIQRRYLMVKKSDYIGGK